MKKKEKKERAKKCIINVLEKYENMKISVQNEKKVYKR